MQFKVYSTLAEFSRKITILLILKITAANEFADDGLLWHRCSRNGQKIVDEAQNATPNQILEIVTRAGKGTKVVLLGDIDQIDNPKLSKRNNGLVFASEKMKGSSLVAQLEFSHEDAVRSPLSIDAAKRLTI